MSTELKMLAFSIVLGMLQLFAASSTAGRQRNLKWNLGPRDQKMPDLTGVAGRLDRALKNFLETFPFFMGAILLVSFLKAETTASALGAQIYFFARLAYGPAYAIGTPVLRTIIWFAALIGLLMVLSALLSV